MASEALQHWRAERADQLNDLVEAHARVGVGDLWKALDDRDRRTPSRRQQLERLNKARNGIAHAKEGPLAELAAEGYRLRLGTFRVWRSALASLAATMDSELAETIGRLFGRSQPW